MGSDKSLLEYHGKPQCYHVYELLEHFCDQTFISCNPGQRQHISKEYKILEDLQRHAGRGPATGVLTAFSVYPGNDFLVVGCDYPFLTRKEMDEFIAAAGSDDLAAAFYDETSGAYQPVVAWYSSAAGSQLLENPIPLRHYLESINARKYIPADPRSMLSVDTADERQQVLTQMQRLK